MNKARPGAAVLPLLALASLATADEISIGQRFELESKQMGELRSVLVHTPPNYSLTKDAYPLLVVLDGNDHFAHVSAGVDFLSADERIPKMIVIGVPNTVRERDLVPPKVGASPPANGGADKFLAFIAEELIPDIERRYRTRPYRVLAGHSNGGLFTIYTLTSRPELFNGYLPISPAFNNQDGLAQRVEALFAANKALRADLFMTLANERGQNLGGAYEMSGLFQEKSSREFRWEFRRYPEETHGSIAMRSVYDGLQAIFNGYYLQDPFASFEQGGLTALERHYAGVSDRLGYAVQLPERLLITVFAALESRGRLDEATVVMKRAAELYPSSAYPNFYLGRIYSALGDRQQSNAYLEKALQLAPAFVAPRALLKQQGVDVATLVPTVQLSSGALAAYTGSYGAPSAVLDIVNRQGALYAKLPQREFLLQPMSDTKFYFVDGEDVLIFRKNARGRITGVTLQSTAVELVKLN
jgi:predicted alpha/beta superfamily hydrolase